MKRVALVVQRFGASITGGAETHAYQLARELHRRCGWSVVVFTTCASDYRTWSNDLPAHSSQIDGLEIRRFRSRIRRWHRASQIIFRVTRLCRRLGIMEAITTFVEKLWFITQGPYCPSLLTELANEADDFDGMVFFTYLYYPTACCPPSLARRSILVPTAHDEPPFYLQTVGQKIRQFGAVLGNTAPEMELIERVHGAPRRSAVVGVGFTPEGANSKLSEAKTGGYIVYLGRICRGKNVHRLIDCFVKYKERHPSQLELRLCGHIEEGFVIPDRTDIVTLGFVDEATKWALLKSANGLVNPSEHESLSMIVLEAFAAECPVVLNADCPVFRYYSEEIPGLQTYADDDEFIARIAWLDSAQGKSNITTEHARTWVEQHYSWDTVVAKYRHFVNALEKQ